MQRLKLLGVVLVAVFALGVFVSATASAAVVVLPGKGETWRGEMGKSSLEVLKGATTILCQKGKLEGTFEATKPLGTFHIDLEGCRAGSVTCTGLGEASETILTLGTFHLVFNKLGTSLSEAGVGVLLLVEPTHLKCSIIEALYVMEGQILCIITPVNNKTKHFEIVCIKGKEVGDPGETVYWNEAGTEVKIGEELFLLHENEKAGAMSNVNVTALILTAEEIEL